MQVPLKLSFLAGIVTKFKAYFVDLILLNILFLAVYIVLNLINYNYGEFWIIFAVIYLIYFTIGDSTITSGQTAGKHKFKIQVIGDNGKELDIIQALLRALYMTVFYFSFNFALLLVEFLNNYILDVISYAFVSFLFTIIICGVTIFLLFHPAYKGLHDVLLHSMVIRKGHYVEDYKEKYLVDNKELSKLTASYFLTVLLAFVIMVFVIMLKILF